MTLIWMAIGFAAISLAISAVTLIIVLELLRSSQRSEQAGDERLEILREQQARLAVMNEERQLLKQALEEALEALERQQRLEKESVRQLVPPEPPEPERRSWWRRLFEG